MDQSEITRSLVKWLQTLSNSNKSVTEISDGVVMCQALVQIDPEYFGKLEPKIKAESSNWRLKVSNLKKIVESVIEYYQDVLNLNVLPIGKPDVQSIGEKSDLVQLGKLLRLILGCAVNCERQQEYITQIMALEEPVQQSIMQAIQQLEEVTGNTGRSGLSLLSMETDNRVLKLMQDLESVTDTKEAFAQRCHDLEAQVQCLLEEKQALLADNLILASQSKEREITDTLRSPDNRRQIELLKEEIFKLEISRDDYRAKTFEQDKQILALQEKNAELQISADATARLKDEIDALSESAEKVRILENSIRSLKKKLEGYGDTKKQLELLENKNVEYYQQNLKYEEELKNSSVWKNQCDVYKKQITDLQHQLDEEMQKTDRGTFKITNLESKLAAAVGEKNRLLQERDSLREEIDEVRLGKEIERGKDGADVAQELTPTVMKERLRFLEKENQTLRNITQDATAKQALLDDALTRIEKLTEQNRKVNQKVLELEALLLEQQKHQYDNSVVEEYKQKINLLQEAINHKDHELHIIQAKYSRSLEKAREVAQNLEIKSREDIELSSHKNMKEREDQMLTVAFYRLGLTRHKEAVDERVLNACQGQSFLARQRQATPRKPVQPFKSK